MADAGVKTLTLKVAYRWPFGPGEDWESWSLARRVAVAFALRFLPVSWFIRASAK